MTVLLAGASLVFALGVVTSADDGTRAATGGVALGLWCLTLASLVAKPLRGASLSLMPVILVYWSVAFGFASYAWLQPQAGSAALIDRAMIPSAQLMVAAGVTAMACGYGVVAANPRHGGPILNYVRGRADDSRSVLAVFVLYGIAVAARAVTLLLSGTLGYAGSIGTANVGPLFQLLTIGAALGPLAVLVASYQKYLERRPGATWRLLALASTETAFALVSGTKEPLVVVGIATTLPWVMQRGRVPWLALSAAVMIFALVIVPFNEGYRAQIRSGNSALAVGQAAGLVPDTLDRSVRQLVKPGERADAIESSLRRLRMIDGVTIIRQRTPDTIAYRPATDLLAAPLVGAVPRVVWPNKPVLDAGQQFGRDYYDTPSSVRSAAAVTTIGDLYRHGGLGVMLFGLVLLGVGIRLVDRAIESSRLVGLVLFVALFPALVKGEVDAVGLLATIPTYVVTVLLATSIATRRRETTSE